MTYFTIDQMLDLIDEPNQTACRRLLEDNQQLFGLCQGSSHNHQAWPGGYIHHVAEVMNIGIVIYNTFTTLRPLPFSLSDLLLVLYLHDVEKPWKYELRDGSLHYREGMKSKEDHHRFRDTKLAEYGITLTDEQLNGLRYTEGELNDYSNKRRVMGPLAALSHMCDVASARLWHNYPDRDYAIDPWFTSELKVDVTPWTELMSKLYENRCADVRELKAESDAERENVARLEAAIRNHRDQKGDDRCWLDDMELYAVLPEGAPKSTQLSLPDRETFLANCARYHASRQDPNSSPHCGPRGRWLSADKIIAIERLLKDD